MTDPYIPPATVNKLATDIPKGSRHHAAMQIAIPLIGSGMSGSAVFSVLRSKFADDMKDSELRKVVEWAESKHPEPCKGAGANGSNGWTARPFFGGAKQQPTKVEAATKSPLDYANWWLSGAKMEVGKMVNKSPVELPEDHVARARLAIGMLYKEAEHLNVVCKFTMDGPKANPSGGGKTMLREAWLDWFTEKGVPSSEAGAWFRINPCSEVGSGKGGAITDADVVAWRYLLVESDFLPIETQLALYSKLNIPIAAIVSSAGKSVHAWVKLESQSIEEYKATGKRLLEILKPFGIDQMNTNCSRLSRLPSANRKIQASNGGLQELVWLNPNVQPLTEESLVKIEESLKFPAIEDQPLKKIAREASLRYDYMMVNVGKLGIPIGVPEFDDISGGLKPGHTMVVAGETGGGKSTFGMHIACSALAAGYGVSLFSLEMDKEEIFDLMLSRKSDICRNKFNTGKFSEMDIKLITQHAKELADLPLYIEDSALVSVDDIRARISQLKSADKISLAIVDYIQFVNPEATRDSREQQVAHISHGLRAIARDFKIPMVVLSQLNEEGKLRESRVIAHNANIVMNVQISEEESEMTINVVKGRGVPKGSYKMRFDAQACKLIPMGKISETDVPPPDNRGGYDT